MQKAWDHLRAELTRIVLGVPWTHDHQRGDASSGLRSLLRGIDQVSRGTRRRPVLAGAVTAAIALCACDPPLEMEGTVSTSAGEPIAGAHVALMCPGDPRIIEAASDIAGHFLHDGAIGWRPADCTVRVSAPHRANYVAPIMDVCAKRPSNVDKACLRVVVHASLN